MQTINELIQAFDAVAWLDTLLRLVLAVAAGAVLGWERERLQKPAGLRTHMMVALGAAAYMLVTLKFTSQLSPDMPLINIDPTRALAGIIGGVGFLGAGTIIESRGNVRGITTAASIWVVAAIGIACGLGMYQIAIPTVAIAILVLTAIGMFEGKAFDDSDDSNDSAAGN